MGNNSVDLLVRQKTISVIMDRQSLILSVSRASAILRDPVLHFGGWMDLTRGYSLGVGKGTISF